MSQNVPLSHPRLRCAVVVVALLPCAACSAERECAEEYAYTNLQTRGAAGTALRTSLDELCEAFPAACGRPADAQPGDRDCLVRVSGCGRLALVYRSLGPRLTVYRGDALVGAGVSDDYQLRAGRCTNFALQAGEWPPIPPESIDAAGADVLPPPEDAVCAAAVVEELGDCP